MTDLGSEMVGLFEEFFQNYYRDEIAVLAQRFPKDQQSLHIEASDLSAYNPELFEDWLEEPEQCQSFAETALGRHDVPADVDLSEANVRLTDHDRRIQRKSVTELEPTGPASDIGNYVAISGQLSRITAASPRLSVAAFECNRCHTIVRIPQGRTDVQEPHECNSCERQGPFSIDHDESTYRKQRKIKLEEPIGERSRARGHSLPVYVQDDLCDYAPGESTLPDHAGERATILGIVRVDESQFKGRNGTPETDFWIDCQAIVYDDGDEYDIDVEAHRDEFERLAQRDDAVDLVAESLAPSLHAGEDSDLHTVRRACAAWLFNAYRVDPDGGEWKRGDFHMCLIGDPGVGKSTIMAYLHDVLPDSQYRTGTGLSEAGLTAAAVQEEFAGHSEWTLQPGILPRANGGHCIIDEIDGVVDENTKAIHDALEGEQVVKADKADIHADLPTRCAVLVGGNPTHTRFDRYESITEQIDLDPALFDRMDLVFAMTDEVDEQSDRTKAEHALDAWDELSQAAADPDVSVDDGTAIDPPVSKATLRAWIKHAREAVRPTLTEASKSRLANYYVEVRDLNDGYDSQYENDAVPATVRTLEAGVRLSIAFARLRLSERVEIEDAERAIDLSREVVGLHFDPETGKFDDMRLGSGDPKSEKERHKALVRLVERFEGETPADPSSVIEAAVTDLHADESKIVHDLENLKRRDAIYEPDGPGNGYRTLS